MYYIESRMYQPFWGRIICADSPYIFAAKNSVINTNHYAYSMNNPVNMIDPSGYAAINEDTYSRRQNVGMFLTNIARLVALYVQNEYKKTNGTYSEGLSVAGRFMGGVSGFVGYAVDTKGNIGISGGYSYGGGYPAIGVVGYRQVSSAPNIRALAGKAFQTGLSGGEVLVVGGDAFISRSDEYNCNVIGGSTSCGLGLRIPIPFEQHAEVTETYINSSFNYFDTVYDILNWVDG